MVQLKKAFKTKVGAVLWSPVAMIHEIAKE